MFSGNGVGQTISLGPVQVRLTSVVSKSEELSGSSAVNGPTKQEAEAALDRVARVMGADKIERVSSDYRRATVATGALSTQVVVIAQAWGQAVRTEKQAEAQLESAKDATKDAEQAMQAEQAAAA